MLNEEKNILETINFSKEKNLKKINVKKLVLKILLIIFSLVAVVGVVLVIAFAKGVL